eukprot:470409-Pleurochrysis_carterae.AAC.1
MAYSTCCIYCRPCAHTPSRVRVYVHVPSALASFDWCTPGAPCYQSLAAAAVCIAGTVTVSAAAAVAPARHCRS